MLAIGELARAIDRLHAMRGLLRLVLRCDCLTLEQCGRRIDAGLRAQRQS